MVQVRAAGVALDQSGQHVILLKPIDELPGEGWILPIWIGAQEATSILIAVEGAATPRPLSHDLMRAMLETLGADVDRVEVTRIDDGTFYAEIGLRDPDDEDAGDRGGRPARERADEIAGDCSCDETSPPIVGVPRFAPCDGLAGSSGVRMTCPQPSFSPMAPPSTSSTARPKKLWR